MTRKFPWGAISTLIAVASLAFAVGAYVAAQRSTSASLEARVSKTEHALKRLALSELPIGTILAWDAVIHNGSGQNDKHSLPDGWLECDGSNGTPNLKNRFLIGWDEIASVGATGGNNTLLPADVSGPTGPATGEGQVSLIREGSGSEVWNSGNGHFHAFNHAHSHNDGDNRPLYYTIIYIMKMK